MMNPNWIGVLAAALSLIGFVMAYRYAEKLETKQKICVGVLACVLALPGASFVVYYAHLLPEFGWYYQFRSLRHTEWLIVPIGVAGGVIASLLPRVVLTLPLLGVAGFSIVPYVKPFLGPLDDGALVDRWEEGVCKQSTGSTCGAASVATILRSFGADVSERELAVDAHSYAGGTEAWYLARAVRERGFKAFFQFGEGFDPEKTLPAVVGVRWGSIGHFIPILAKQGDRFIIGDPTVGKEMLSRDALHERYEFSGFYMMISEE